MLKTELLHPEILQILGANWHGSKILIADGNYPFTTGSPATAKKVFLNLAPGMLSVIDVLKVLSQYVPVESAVIMLPPDDSIPPIHTEFTEVLGADMTFVKVKRFDFYDAVKTSDTCLVITTGETRRFSNILLTIGVRKFD